MNKPPRQLVSPSGKGKETMYVLLAALLVGITCATLIFINQKQSQVADLANFQIRAFSDLNDKELAVFNGLYTAAVEINEIHNEGEEWLTVPQLEEEFMPPFTRDASWKKSGRFSWNRELRPAGSMDIALYTGHPGQGESTGSFILLFLHDHKKKQGSARTGPRHAPYEIWYHTSANKPAPQVATDQGFIAAGWKEVIAYSGEDEVKRIKG
ncbi:DUF6162 family protein [Desulfovibrio sp. JC010]|uniref:DUF6162 family protein n=1 Tax=Desulfovibrio sp. JC010 TaxID=2593641 RepID=UPI0013D4129A|nr:hypothetical protein [Desulfovibrio sp. JC010]NDV25167.1 hypothetical protein [Desulfovibrio sp. JC010]